MENDSLPSRLDARLTPPERRALAVLAALAHQSGVALYLVGGAVRDLLLDRPGLDLDLVLEAPVEPIARELASKLEGRAVLHEGFGTATVRGPGFEVDLAQTRRETYSRPGALPTVELISDIEEDLARRDFTINAMALRLSGTGAEVIDPHHGRADLDAALVRVLHEESFQDDATRMLRALRYSTRLDFQLERHTETWLRRDLPYVDNISGPRLRRELVLALGEERAPAAMFLAARLRILSRIHPRLDIDAALANRWSARATDLHGPLDELGFCLLASHATLEDVASLSARLHLSGRYETALTDFVRLRDASDKLAPDDPVAVVETMDGCAIAAVWALTLLDDAVAAGAASNYLQRWRQVRPQLTGRDLQALGATPGPALGAILKELRNGRLEGRIQTRDDEVTLAKRLVQENEKA